MDRVFLKKAMKLGKEAEVDLNHGNGVDDEESAKDFIEHYKQLLVDLSTEFSNLNKALKVKFPNIK